jgi:DNA-binding MarR family transcriptional regulator
MAGEEGFSGDDIQFEQQEVMELWHIFSRVAMNGKRMMERELELKGIKPIELRILYNLSRHESVPMNSLSSENNVTSPWITGIVEEMEKKGYVSKERNELDRRAINVTILEKGREILSGGLGVYANLISSSLEHLTPDEKEQFKKILLKIEDSLNR